MKILFVRPNRDTFGYKPVGISLLSALCKQAGHEVRLFDTTFYDTGVEEYSLYASKINKYKPVDFSAYDLRKVKGDLKAEVFAVMQDFSPDVCAFSLTSDDRFLAQELAEYIKRFDRSIPVIWGGAHPTVCPDEVINLDCVDYACLGEGIEALPEMLEALEKGNDTTTIKNFYGKHQGRIYKNDMRELFLDFDSLPFLDWEIFDNRQFLKPFDGRITICGDFMSNFGCPYHCSYCINSTLHSFTKRRVRHYSPARAIQELKYLKEKYHLTLIRFPDEDFLMRPMAELEEFAELYIQEIALPFSIKTHPRTVSQKKVDLLKKMGNQGVNIGVESGNDYIRKEILKRVESIEDVKKAFKLFVDAGIRTGAYVMMGLPFEDRAKIFESIELCREIKPTVIEHGFFFPFEGTDLYQVSVDHGFYDKAEVPIFNWHTPTLKLPGISREELMGIYRCFPLYVKFPKSYYPLIERAEKNDAVGEELFNLLGKIYYDHVALNDGFFHE
jgi:radical SAM superfamily enzyme YgiQ (UPF0313 family)